MPELPPITFRRPRWMTPAYLGLVVAVPVATILVVVLGSSSSDDVYGTLSYLALMCSVAGGTLAWVRWRGRHTRRRLQAAAPSGTVYAAPCWRTESGPADPPGRVESSLLWTAGLLLIGDEGVSFTRRKPGQSFPEVRLSWSQIASVHWKRTTPFKGMLRVRTTDRQLHGWELAVAVEDALRLLGKQASGVDG